MTGNTILVVDTDTEMMQKIMLALESEGYLVFTASSQDVGITMANKVKPSLIYINIGIEGVSGLEICKAIHQTKTLENVPIVIITPHEGKIDSRYTSLYGIVDFLKKPFTDEELLSKTKNIFSVKSVEEPVEEGLAAQSIEEWEGIEAEPVTEEVEVLSIEEEVTAKPAGAEVDKKLFEEEGAQEEFFKEATEVEPIEEKIEIKPAEDEFEAQFIEEEIEMGKDEIPSTKKEKISDTKKEEIEDIVLDETEVKQTKDEIDEEIAEQFTVEETKGDLTETPSVSQKRDSLYRSKKGRKEDGMKKWIFVPVVGLVIIGIVAAGIIIFKDFILEKKIPLPAVVTPSKPEQQQVAKVAPSQEQQKPKQTVEVTKPAQKPAPAVKQKPAGKALYSVQIGVFKSEDNSNSLVKKYKEKGYDAFIQKSTAQDKGVLNRVLIGRFDNKKEAANLAKNISSKENISVIIFRQ